MSELRGTVFISHASNDKDYVEKIRNRLDPTITFYDTKTIQPGQPTLEAMKSGIKQASVFVLIHSEENTSVWVDFEKSLAEIQKISRPSMQILACPINGSTYKSLPSWMHSFMTTTEDFTPNDIVRSIQFLYQKCLFESFPDALRTHPGRESLKREIMLAVMQSSASVGVPLSALVLSGIQGMGRSTLASELIRDAYPGMRPGGPTFEIPEAGDAIDWHLQLLGDVRGELSDAEIEKQISSFKTLLPTQQASVLFSSLKHWGTLNQVVTIRHRWGLRERGNTLKPWLHELFTQIRAEASIRLILISERQLPQVEIRSLGNVVQFHLEELDRNSIQTILSSRIQPRFLDIQRLPDLADRINGHPSTANFVSFLVSSGRSMDSLVISPSQIYAFQDSILNALYESDTLSELHKSLLHLLSWFPRLSASIISSVFPEIDKNLLTEGLWSLADFSLVSQTEMGRYSCPAVVASTYRRRNHGGYDVILSRVAEALTEQFDTNNLDFDLIDSLVVAVVSLEMEISPRLKRLLTPARLLPAVENQYGQGLSSANEQAQAHFERCRSLCELAINMRMSDDDLENFLFYGGDSSVRLGQYPKTMISVMRVKGFLTADYIEGSYLYHKQRDFEGAAAVLSQSLSASRFRVRNVRLLTRIYLRSGKFSQALIALQYLPDSRILRDTGLVIMKLKALRGTRNRSDAQKLLASLSNRADDHGDIALYRAGEALRNGKYPEALDYAKQASKAPKVNQVVISILICACEIEIGNIANLSQTCTVARSVGRDSDAYQLQARAALKQGDWRSSLDYINRVKRKDWFDLNVELRANQMKLQDVAISNDPVEIGDTNQKLEEILRDINDAIEGNNLLYS